jgi:hypothetical protein
MLLPFVGGKPIPSFSPIFNANGFNSDAGVSGISCRNVIKPPVGGWPKGGSKIKVIFGSFTNAEGYSGTGTLRTYIEHASIGKLVIGAYTQPNTQAVPVQLTFPSYVDTANTTPPSTIIPPYNLAETNELAFDFTPTDAFVVIMDFAGLNVGRCIFSSSMSNCEFWQHNGNSWNLATVTLYSRTGPGLVGVVSIKAK